MQTLNWINYDVKPYFENTTLVGILAVLLIFYAPYAQQPLPNFMYKLFKSPIFLMIFFFAIIMIGIQDFRVSFIVALVLASILHAYNQRLVTEAFLSGLEEEGFEVNNLDDN